MRLGSARQGPFVIAATLCAALAACSSDTDPHGSPVLTQVYWAAGGSQFLVWSLDPDPGLVSPVPPFASEVDFVFDRLLDGSRIDNIVTVNGMTETQPKDTPAIVATWPNMATMNSSPPFSLVVDYNSVPLYGGATAYLLARPAVPGFPASDTVSFELIRSFITSAYGDLATVPSSVPVKTERLAVQIVTSAGAVAPSFQVPLAFTNRLPPAPATSPFVHVRLGGAEVPYKVLADAGLASRWYLVAADCLGGTWPANATLAVTIDAGFLDAFGDPLAQVATATFSTSASTTVPVAATCAIPDAGAADGGASDALITDGPAAETAPDGGAGEAPDGGADDSAPDAG